MYWDFCTLLTGTQTRTVQILLFTFGNRERVWCKHMRPQQAEEWQGPTQQICKCWGSWRKPLVWKQAAGSGKPPLLPRAVRRWVPAKGNFSLAATSARMGNCCFHCPKNWSCRLTSRFTSNVRSETSEGLVENGKWLLTQGRLYEGK